MFSVTCWENNSPRVWKMYQPCNARDQSPSGLSPKRSDTPNFSFQWLATITITRRLL